MIDWHSHILPKMDDGSRNAAESLSLIEMLTEQRVDTVVATPHFYANDDTVETFLERRNKSFEKLSAHLQGSYPRILLGAEVRYYEGVGRMTELGKLCIEGTKLLLLEMSFTKWTEYTIREVIELAGSRDIIVTLAHIDRYMKFQSASTWERLYESGVLMQMNASFFAELGSRRKALSLLEGGGIHFLGSDCHNTTSRPPRIGKAFDIIEKKLGEHYLSQMDEYGHSMLVQK